MTNDTFNEIDFFIIFVIGGTMVFLWSGKSMTWLGKVFGTYFFPVVVGIVCYIYYVQRKKEKKDRQEPKELSNLNI